MSQSPIQAASNQAVPLSEATLRAALGRVPAPGGGNLGSAGLIDAVQVKDGLVHLALRAERSTAGAMEQARLQAVAALSALPGVLNVTAVLTAHRPAPASPSPAPGPAPSARPQLVPGVRAIVAVASGKGGVGKSTTAVNLAVCLARQGLRVGLLDADIYGPSLPRMLGVTAKPEMRGKQMVPITAWGLQAMSIGFLVDEQTAMIWRGPMVMSALEQMLGQVEWGVLDILVIDMPPGTGDAQLTLSQRLSLTGAVIVSTPQDIALLDARRGIAMFEKTRVPVLGLVENMSFFACPHCGERTDIFGHGGAREEARRHGVEFLGEVPLLLSIRTHSDEGTPVALAEPEGVAGRAYAALAARVWEKTEGRLRELASSAPRIIVE